MTDILQNVDRAFAEQASIKIQSVRRKHGTGGRTMRLIDADRLIDNLRGNVLIDVTPELEDTIAQQPTAFGGIKESLQLRNYGWKACYDGRQIG